MSKPMQRGDVNKTAVIECRCDIRLLKTVLDHLNKIGYPVYTKSDLIATAVKIAANTLVDSGLVEECVSFEEAHLALSVFNKTKRDRRADMHLSAVISERDIIAGLIGDKGKGMITVDDVLAVTRRVEDMLSSKPELSKEAQDVPDLSTIPSAVNEE